MEKNNTILPSDEIFTTSIRLTIMLILFSHKKILLNELKEILQLSSGNLDHHIRKLVNVGYIITRKSFFPGRPLTVVEMTSKGYTEFKDYLKKMKKILNQIPLD